MWCCQVDMCCCQVDMWCCQVNMWCCQVDMWCCQVDMWCCQVDMWCYQVWCRCCSGCEQPLWDSALMILAFHAAVGCLQIHGQQNLLGSDTYPEHSSCIYYFNAVKHTYKEHTSPGLDNILQCHLIECSCSLFCLVDVLNMLRCWCSLN